MDCWPMPAMTRASAGEPANAHCCPDDKAGNVLGVLSPKLVRLPIDDRNGNPMMLDIRR